MQIGVASSPTNDWSGALAAARLADELGLASVGFWDHYHSDRRDWGYLAGWSAHAGLTMATKRIAVLPMVICNLNHELGQLAKETSTLAIQSGGRFELGIGAGDYPVEYRAWGRPFPPPDVRIGRLLETIAALRELWTGEPVTRDGAHVRLTGAISAPAPPSAPRIVVGVGDSRRLIDLIVKDADELNVYVDPPVVAYARDAIAAAGRTIPVSGYRNYDWGAWPADLVADLSPGRDGGLSRVVVNVGFERDMEWRIRELAEAQERLR